MKSYKGFNKNLTCRGFQYEEGEEYEIDEAIVCEKGFHACEYPLDCFGYYNPAESVFHEVEQSGELSKKSNDDTKVASSKIKIGARLQIADIVSAAIEYTKERVNPEAKADKNYGASSATGYKGASSAMNATAIAVAWGYKSKAKGIKGSHIILADWEGDNDYPCESEKWKLKGAYMIQIDGDKYKEDTYYTVVDGKIVEAEPEE